MLKKEDNSIDIQDKIDRFSNLLSNIENETKLVETKNIFLKNEIRPLYDVLKKSSLEEKKQLGKLLNELNQQIERRFSERLSELRANNENKNNVLQYDPLIRSCDLSKGNLTILDIVEKQVVDFFKRLNFDVFEEDEIVKITDNMDKLNIDINHPARANNDSFYIDKMNMLRTHCTSNTAQKIYQTKKELKIVSVGNVYRNDDDDLTHSHQFRQIDFVWLKKDFSVNHLKTIIDELLKHLFGRDIKTRYRLSYFPFTEPSFEIDINCFKCHGKGCNLCKKSGWIEILGAGMLHENVFKLANIKNIKTGLAAGLGVERIAMLKYGITDIRNIYNNDFRLIKQLSKI